MSQDEFDYKILVINEVQDEVEEGDDDDEYEYEDGDEYDEDEIYVEQA